MLVSLKKFVGAAAVASVFCVSLPAQQPQGQAQGQGQAQAQPAAGGAAQKNWKDRAEYDLYESITKEATPAKRLELLNQWNEKYPATEFKLERQLLYLDTYQKLGQAPKILESAKNIIAIDPQNLTALYWMAYLTSSMNDTSPDSARCRREGRQRPSGGAANGFRTSEEARGNDGRAVDESPDRHGSAWPTRRSAGSR